LRHDLIKFLLIVLVLMLCTVPSISAGWISGFVKDSLGGPIDGADLDFFDAATGVKYNTSGIDNTGPPWPAGEYRLNLLPNTFNISFDPPDSTHFLGTWLYGIELSFNDTVLSDVFLGSGLAINGLVTDSLGVPIGDVDIDIDSLGGGRVYTPNDRTKLVTGRYWVVAPPGDYRIRYDAPPGSRYMGVEIDSLRLSPADIAMNVMLAQGVLLAGKVSDPFGVGIFDVEVDLRKLATGEKLFISNNETDLNGMYNVAAPPGTYELRYSPPKGSRFVGAQIDTFTITADMVVNQTLQSGIIVTVNITDSVGTPVQKADIDFKLQSSGTKIFTPHDKTNPAGTAVVAVLPDVYIVQLDPPLGTIFDQVISGPVDITADTVLNFIMPEVPRINFTGQVTGSTGAGLGGIDIDLRIQPGNYKVYVPVNNTDGSGFFNLSVPIGTYDLLFSPIKGSRLVGLRVKDVTFVNDTSSNFQLATGLLVTGIVLDPVGMPLYYFDFNFMSETDGIEVFTPYDNSDSTGTALMVLPADLYSVILTPPPWSLDTAETFKGVSIQSDTTLTFRYGSVKQPNASFLLKQNYPNPFNQTTEIVFSLTRSADISLDIYNTLGRLVKNLKSGFHEATTHNIEWDGRNRSGKEVASGVYFYRLRTPIGSNTRQMVLIR